MNAINEIVEHVNKIANGKHDTLRPGMPLRFSEACVENDRIWQGDLAITIVNKKPNGYKLCKNPKLQVVPGANLGAKHCLDSLDGVNMYVPETWNEESLDGPYLRLTQERTITHPVHGDVTIPAGFSVVCTYQREYDKEQERERRARD